MRAILDAMVNVPPVPPPDLVARIGGTCEQYLEFALAQRRILESLLPANWSLDGKAVLDLGCGPGRTLSAFLEEGETAEFVGCDIHAESIAWASSALSPPFTFFMCHETPPLAQPDQRFDLVYAMSVFTHITDQWSNWLVELHRVMRRGAIAVVSVLGPIVASREFGIDWDDRIGMVSMNFHQGWEIGGPSTLLAEWWVREHWGRAFEILSFEHPDEWFDQDFVVMRKREVTVTAEQLEAVDHRDSREYASLACNLELLRRQQQTLGEQVREARRARLAAETFAQRQQAELERLTRLLHEISGSRSWRLTAPLRRARRRTSRPSS